MTRSPPWIEAENARCVTLYFEMLEAEQNGESYVKAKMIREAQCLDGAHQELIGRNRGSIEFKLMNATAAHADILAEADDHQHDTGDYLLRTMHDHGYRALPNYQAGLKAAMVAAMELAEQDNQDRPAAAG